MAGGRSENAWGQLVTWSAQSAPSLVEIGLTGLSKTGGSPLAKKPPTALQANGGNSKKIIITQKKVLPLLCAGLWSFTTISVNRQFFYTNHLELPLVLSDLQKSNQRFEN